MNEILSRALLRAKLSDEDVAACLQVDPKTVRRWIEGRIPYLRHRWALALLVNMNELDLWPQLRSARPTPGEVVRVYAHRDWLPTELWLRLFALADQEIGVLADSEFLLGADSAILSSLAERAASGVRVRVCIPDPTPLRAASPVSGGGANGLAAARIRQLLVPAEFRVHRIPLLNSICYGDEHLLVIQHAYGVQEGRAPVLHLHGKADADMIAAYRDSFEHLWSNAQEVR